MHVESIAENRLLQLFRALPSEKREEVLDFALFISRKFDTGVNSPDTQEKTNPVEETWGTIKIDKDLIHYIAEDEELEYDV